MSVPVTAGTRVTQLVLVTVMVVAGHAAYASASVSAEAFDGAGPDAVAGLMWAAVFVLPLLLTIWWLGYASRNRDDPEKVKRAWWIMMGVLAAFHAYTEHENRVMAQRRNQANADFAAQAEQDRIARSNADFMRQVQAMAQQPQQQDQAAMTFAQQHAKRRAEGGW